MPATSGGKQQHHQHDDLVAQNTFAPTAFGGEDFFGGGGIEQSMASGQFGVAANNAPQIDPDDIANAVLVRMQSFLSQNPNLFAQQ